ncbi:MAG: hypothetical protein Fur006_51220 [Coleofasciculaceae cyanobacterium]
MTGKDFEHLIDAIMELHATTDGEFSWRDVVYNIAWRLEAHAQVLASVDRPEAWKIKEIAKILYRVEDSPHIKQAFSLLVGK